MSTTPRIFPADLPADIRAAVAAVLSNLPAPTAGPLSGVDLDLYGRISDDTKRKGTRAEGRNAIEQISDAAHSAVALGADPARMTAHVENDRSAFKRTRVTVTMFGETFTAERVDRPVWRAMLAGIRKNPPGRAVFALDLDRLARDPQDVEDAITTTSLHGARWYERTGGPMNLHTSDGQMVARFKVTMANKSSHDTSRRVARAHERRQATGRPNWPTRPFGHERDGSLNADESEAIQQAAHDLINAAGTTLYTIVKAWNAAGILPAGKPRGDRPAAWTIASLGAMLRSPRLAALVTVDGVIREDIPAQWLPILTPARWRTMVGKLDENGAAHALHGVTHRPTNLLSGIAECYVCDGRIAVNRNGSGARYYVCPGGHVRVPADALDRHTARWVLAGQRTGALRSGVYSPLLPRESADTAPLAASVDAASARVAAVQEQMLTADPAAIGALAAVLSRATADRDALRKQLDAANAEIERATSFDAMLSEWDALTVDGRRGILRRLTAAGWHFQLRPFVIGEPDERVTIFNEHDLAADAAEAA